jgi:CheY-like chemotaxis protein
MTAKIMIVDDDAETIEFLTLILTRQGYQVIAATNGMESLRLAHSENPDLIVLDVMMPDIDGYEVARSLRRRPETAVIPILMFTAKTQVEDKVAGYESGVDIYLTKPVHPMELHANIKALLVQRTASAETIGEHGYVIGVIAAKGGLGVSTTALNLAISYHEKYKDNVIAAELKPGQGSWASELDFSDPCGLCNLLEMNVSEITSTAVEGQLVTTPFNVRLLLASNDPADLVSISNVEQYEAVLQQLSLLAPLVVLDIGTSFLPAYNAVTDICDEIIVVTEPHPNSVKRTRYLIDDLRNNGFGSAKVMTVVSVNHTRSDMVLSMSDIEGEIKQTVTLGIPPSTELSYQAAVRSIPMVQVQPESLVAQQFASLAEKISERVHQ